MLRLTNRSACEGGAVVQRIGGVVRHVAAAVHEDDDRQAAIVADRPPDIEVQTVFAAHHLVQRRADGCVVPVVRAGSINAAVLRAGVAELLGRLRRCPGVRIGRGLPRKAPVGGFANGTRLSTRKCQWRRRCQRPRGCRNVSLAPPAIVRRSTLSCFRPASRPQVRTKFCGFSGSDQRRNSGRGRGCDPRRQIILNNMDPLTHGNSARPQTTTVYTAVLSSGTTGPNGSSTTTRASSGGLPTIAGGMK